MSFADSSKDLESGSRDEIGRFLPGNKSSGKRSAGRYAFLDEIRRMEPAALLVMERVMGEVRGKDRMPTAAAFKAAETVVAYSRGKPTVTQTVRFIRSLDDLSTEELELLLGEGKPAAEAPQIEGIAE